MNSDKEALAKLVAKDEIRELVDLYVRATDRHDIALMDSLFTRDAWHDHSGVFKGSQEEFIKFLEDVWSGTNAKLDFDIGFSANYLLGHLISIESETEALGEVRLVAAYDHCPRNEGPAIQQFFMTRYLDRYRRENGRWFFARRDVLVERTIDRPLASPSPFTAQDPSYQLLPGRLFARGARAL